MCFLFFSSSAKWSSSEELTRTLADDVSLRDGPRVWTPAGGQQPAGDPDFRPVRFDGDSLQRGKRQQQQLQQQHKKKVR